MRKRWIKMAAGVVLMLAVAAGAWNMPGIVYSVSDRNALQKQEAIHMNLKQFARDGSMQEQLLKLALCGNKNNGYSMKAVKVQEGVQIASDEELTQIIQAELFQFNNLLEDAPMIRKEDLVSRELYTAYITGGLEDSREGITFWRVCYQQTDDEADKYELEIILDMEYHKIYELKLNNTNIDKRCSEYAATKAKSKKRGAATLEESWGFILLMADYYGVSEKNDSVFIDVGNIYWYENANMVEARETAQTDAAKDESRAETIVYSEEDSEPGICYQLKGFFEYFQDDLETWLNFKKEFVREESGKGYLRIGITDLEAILQI